VVRYRVECETEAGKLVKYFDDINLAYNFINMMQTYTKWKCKLIVEHEERPAERLRRLVETLKLTDEEYIKYRLEEIAKERESVARDISEFKRRKELIERYYDVATCPLCGRPIQNPSTFWKMRLEEVEKTIKELEEKERKLEEEERQLWKALEEIQLKRKK